MHLGTFGDDLVLPAGRAKLVTVLAATGDVVTVGEAARALDLSRARTAKTLSRWAKQGWLRRVGPGAYVPAPLDMLNMPQVV